MNCAMLFLQQISCPINSVMKCRVIAAKISVRLLNIMGRFDPGHFDSPNHLRESKFDVTNCLIDRLVKFYEVVRSGPEIGHNLRYFLRLHFGKSFTLRGSDADVYHRVTWKLSLHPLSKKYQRLFGLLDRHLPRGHEAILSGPKGAENAYDRAQETQKISGLHSFWQCPQTGETPTSHAPYSSAAYRRETLTLFHTKSGFQLPKGSTYCAASFSRKALTAHPTSVSRELTHVAVNASNFETTPARITSAIAEQG